MYVLIDCTNYKAIATHDSYRALAALSYIQYANVDVVIHPTSENKHYAQFNEAQLTSIFNGIVDSATSPFKTGSYSDSIHRVREMIMSAPHLRLPFTETNLEAQAEKIKEDDTRPYKVTAGASPQRLEHWHVPPDRDRPRYNKPTAVQLTRTTGSIVREPVDTGTEGAPAPDKPKRAPPVKRAKGSNRPAPGSTTGKVWDIADEMGKNIEPVVLASKEFRKIVISACKEAGINPSTASVQFGAWLAACSK